MEPVKVSEPTPVKSGEPAKIPSKLDTLRSTKVGLINLAMPKTKRATAIVASNEQRQYRHLRRELLREVLKL